MLGMKDQTRTTPSVRSPHREGLSLKDSLSLLGEAEYVGSIPGEPEIKNTNSNIKKLDLK